MGINIPNPIIDSAHKGNLVFFIGSGFSKDFGYPDWKGLVEKILEGAIYNDQDYEPYLKLLKNGKMPLLDVLDYIKEEKRTIAATIEHEFQYTANGNNTLAKHKKIFKISKKIITTNYDQLLEKAIDDTIPPILTTNTHKIAQLSQSNSFIYKIHGDYLDPGNCVLLREDYTKLYENDSAALETLKNIITNNVVVFIGFSMEDPYISNLFGYINSIYQGYQEKGYILTMNDKDFSNYNIKKIQLKNHDEIPLFLDKLYGELKKKINNETNELSIPDSEKIQQKNPSEFSIEIMPKIALLISSPLDMESFYKKENILKFFIKYNVVIDVYYFSIERLNELEGYNYVFIFTQKIQNKIVIEDEYFKGTLISLEQLEDQFGSNDTSGVFIFIDKDTEFYTTDKITIPLTILEYQDNLNSFLFKLFKKACKLHALSYVQIFNENKFTITQIQFSNAKINEKSKISKLSSSIERKNLSNFVGRKTDIIDLTRKILNLSDRILTIKGSGGIGKTTIAKKIALEFFDRSYFIDGIHFIDCEAINDLQTFKRNIAKTFNLEEAINFEEHVRNYELRKDSLIILDNFETLLDLSERSEIKQLITFISNFVTIIITSREWVGFEFEEKHELRNFTREEAFDLFQNLYSHELNNEEERRILQKDILEKLLNNNPLAIKIVTKNLPKFTEMSALRDELRTNFFKATNTDYEDIFHSPSDENIERSESLYQSIYYSYAKLSPKEQLTFEILSLFPNGIQMESFKEFFQNKTYMITNKEIKRLEDKSLIEINNGHLTLQSIIGRFADFHLNQRSADEKIDYFKSAYNYNLYLLTLLIEKKQAGRTNQALKIYDKFEDNFIKSLNYIKETGIENTTLIAYITSLIPFSSLIGSMSKITNQFHKCTKIFMNVPNGELLKEILLLTSDYYEKDLDKPFEYLKEKNMLEQLDTLDLDTIEITNSQIVVKVLSIYATEGYHFEAIEFMHRRKHYEIIDFGISLMCLGSFNHVIKLQEEKNVPKDFFYFESKYNLGILTIEEIDEYIQNDIFNKRHMEIMQSNYLKTKMGFAEKEIIEKLVVTNTYTMGLKNLMLAILEENVDVKINLFEQAISNLKHIHYYYTEAIYFYCAFLKTINSNTFDLWYNLGRNSAEKSYYKYLIHKYYSMENNSCILYDENNYSLPDEFNVQLFIDEYLNSRRSELSYNNL